MASAEGGSAPSGMSVGRGVPSPADYGVCVSVVISPSGERGRAPAGSGFWRILKATERSFLYLYDKIWGISGISPHSKLWVDLSPSVPISTPMNISPLRNIFLDSSISLKGLSVPNSNFVKTEVLKTLGETQSVKLQQ